MKKYLFKQSPYSKNIFKPIMIINKYIDEEKGVGAKDRPNSSAITQSSNIPNPRPPYSSGMAVPVQPISAISFHKFSEYLFSSSSRIDLTKERSHLSCKNFLA